MEKEHWNVPQTDGKTKNDYQRRVYPKGVGCSAWLTDAELEAKFPPPAAPEPTPEEQAAAAQAEFTTRIQQRLDDFARTRNYDGILSAASYATSGNAQFRSEGEYAVKARDDTWAKGYELLAGYQQTGTIPAWEEIEAQLPPLAWPES